VSPAWPTAHQKVLRNYTAVILLKQGGQKAAYRAHHADHGNVVVKIGSYATINGLKRIQREVEVLRGLNSKYYPRNIAFSTEPPNQFVIVEEYVDSVPLSASLTQFSAPAEALAFLRHLVQGLSIIWEKRVVHRDIKPDNILVAPDGVPKIIDLGIARLLDDESLTRTLNARGPCTPNYASPEQLKNRKAQIDQRADQFGLGIVFLQLLLSGAHPFDPAIVGSGDSIVSNILSDKWCRAKLQRCSHPSSIQSLAAKLLGPEPFQRYRTTASLLSAITVCERELS